MGGVAGQEVTVTVDSTAVRRRTVLVVDDETSVHLIVKLKLRRLPGLRLLHAYCGWQAQALLGQQEIHLVLLDVNLPDTTGLNVLAEMRQLGEHPAVMMLSGADDPETVSTALELGALAFLSKTAESYDALSTHVGRIMSSIAIPH